MRDFVVGLALPRGRRLAGLPSRQRRAPMRSPRWLRQGYRGRNRRWAQRAGQATGWNEIESRCTGLGGISAIALGLSYLAITALYGLAGAVPSGGGAQWLDYLSGKTATWWGIVGLSVLTDVLFVPVLAALYVALRTVNRNALLAGVGLVGLFVVLDLAVTWPNYAALIALSSDPAAATDEAQRAADVAAAGYPASVLGSTLLGVYAILVPAVGIGMIGVVMLGRTFGRAAAYAGVLVGVLGIVAVVGPILWSPLGAVAIPASVLTTVWVLLVGCQLLAIGRRPALDHAA